MASAIDFESVLRGVENKKKKAETGIQKESLFVRVDRESMVPTNGKKNVKGYAFECEIISASSGSRLKKGDKVRVVVPDGNSLEKLDLSIGKNGMGSRSQEAPTLFLEGAVIKEGQESLEVTAEYAKAARPQLNSRGEPNHGGLVISVGDGEHLDDAYISQPVLVIGDDKGNKKYFGGFKGIQAAIRSGHVVIDGVVADPKTGVLMHSDKNSQEPLSDGDIASLVKLIKADPNRLVNLDKMSAFTNKFMTAHASKIDLSGTIMDGIVQSVESLKDRGFENPVVRLMLGNQDDGFKVLVAYTKTYGVDDIPSMIQDIEIDGRKLKSLIDAIEPLKGQVEIYADAIPTMTQPVMKSHQLPALVADNLRAFTSSEVVEKFYNAIDHKLVPAGGVAYAFQDKNGLVVLSSPVTVSYKTSQLHGIEVVPTATIPKNVLENAKAFVFESVIGHEAKDSHPKENAASETSLEDDDASPEEDYDLSLEDVFDSIESSPSM